MTILPNQPEVYYCYDFQLFEMLGAHDKAWFNILRTARAVTLDYCQEYGYFKLCPTYVLTFFPFNEEQCFSTHSFHPSFQAMTCYNTYAILRHEEICNTLSYLLFSFPFEHLGLFYIFTVIISISPCSLR